MAFTDVEMAISMSLIVAQEMAVGQTVVTA